MKILFSICYLLFTTMWGSLVLAEEPLHKTNPVLFLTLQNYRVLSGRIHKILEYRLSSLNQCSVDTQKKLKMRFEKLPLYSDNREVVLDFLSLYSDSLNVEKSCLDTLDKNERGFKNFERERFSSIHKTLDTLCDSSKNSENDFGDTGSIGRNCYLKVHQVFSDLDPHCVSFQVPNFTNSVDPFPCMMADYMIGRSMVSETSWEKHIQNTARFMDQLRKAFGRPNAREQGINLWEIFLGSKKDTPALREEFLAQLNFFFSSSQSASSYIRGFHDHVWQFILRKTNSPSVTLDYFLSTRIQINEFQTVYNWAVKNNYPMNIQGIQMAGKNRHNFMAAYLACHYREENSVFFESLPVMLGYAYESFDLKSHLIEDKDSFEVAKENFDIDTNRYRTGVYWGYRFCKQQF